MKRSVLYASLIALTLITSGYAIADFDKGLVVYFTFDNIKGKRILDESGNGLDAEVVKDTKFVKGKYGNGIHITNDTEDCVNVPTTDELEISEEITMMAWIYHDDWKGSSSQWFDKGCYSARSNSLYGMGVFDENDDPDLAFLPNGSGIGIILGTREFHVRMAVENKMRNGKWHHVVGVCEDLNVRMYLDGENILENDEKPPFIFNGINEEDLRIGCAKGKSEYAFEGGSIDEVAIWNRALSETEIRAVMRGALFAVSPKDKVATTWGNIKRKALQP
ncbi:MAG: LamG domain-containing protein [Candidatus Poribacteria bacterium]|nr:LamG domain-containing protein [Candidatus Poribacteria bacterium]